ncbi:MAG: hypothetical protein ABUL73_03385 [Alphaproteobacteria bacterium]
MARVQRIIIGRTAGASLIAASAGALALAAPIVALLLLAALAAYVLMRPERALRFNPRDFTGPVFAALIAGALVGLPVAIGVLFVWRLWADTRWSVGETKRLAVAAGRPGETRFIALAHAWLTPAFGLSIVAYTAPHMVVGLPLDLPHVPNWVPLSIGGLAALGVFDWAVRQAADWRLGELAPAPAAHMLAHHVVFLLAYGLTLDISAGLVALAAWRLAHAAPLKLPQLNFTAVP